MKWPLDAVPVSRSEIPLYNLCYLHAANASSVDPTIVWGSEVELDELQAYLRDRNRDSGILLSPVHVLLQAVSHALTKHPEFNRRVIGRRVFAYREINLRLAFRNQRSGEVGIVLLRRVNELCLGEIARTVWSSVIELATGRWNGERDCRRLKRLPSFLFHWLSRIYTWLDHHFRLPTVGRLDALRSGAVYVSDLSFHGAPPMRCYKPSRFPDESSAISVTLGPAEDRVQVRRGAMVISKVAPLIIRVDHRLVDAYQLGRFMATVRELMVHPGVMEGIVTTGSESDGNQFPRMASAPRPHDLGEAA
jgi:hypothetical protein